MQAISLTGIKQAVFGQASPNVLSGTNNYRQHERVVPKSAATGPERPSKHIEGEGRRPSQSDHPLVPAPWQRCANRIALKDGTSNQHHEKSDCAHCGRKVTHESRVVVWIRKGKLFNQCELTTS
jgi:hypothetical protein